MKKAIKQSKLIFIINLVTVFLLLIILGSLWVTAMQSRAADKMNENRFQLTENATRFMNASAYLTGEVRAYSATGDKIHADNYRKEKNETKTREMSIENMKLVGISADEEAKIDEMMAISARLMPLEEKAIADVAAGDLRAAVRGVLGVQYNEQVTKMGAAKEEFLNLMVERTSEQVRQGVVATRILELQTFVLVLIIILMRIYSYNVVRKKVIRPIIAVENEMRRVAAGDLSSNFHLEPDTSEIGMLIDSILTTKSELRRYIRDISEKLAQMAQQNFSISVDIDYVGDFSPIKDALSQIILSLNRALYKIDEAANEVANGSGQVSDNAQSVASGTSEQASAMEQISETIQHISGQVQETADSSSMATELANAAGVQLGRSNEQLQGMLTAMNEISDASGEIGKIIKTIEDIAFQTNILALNAAVEAARAGVAGKGFAVVADEVRNLANKSAEASKNTSLMIENSLKTIQSGAKIAKEASDTFVTVMVNAGRAAEAMGGITIATKEQSRAIARVTQSMEQISSVVQNNATNSEESAAVSEQMLQQAEELRALVRQFQLLKPGVQQGAAANM